MNSRVAILDWDVHHGNGTEEIFWDDGSVLFVSLHQWPFYPGTGGPDDQAETTLNVPLPAGSTARVNAASYSASPDPAGSGTFTVVSAWSSGPPVPG